MTIVEELLCRGDPTEQDLLQQGSAAYTGSPFGVSFCRQLGDAAAQSDYPALRTSGRGPTTVQVQRQPRPAWGHLACATEQSADGHRMLCVWMGFENSSCEQRPGAAAASEVKDMLNADAACLGS